jgi:drug/metabolite transporter (DMT)-like permease
MFFRDKINLSRIIGLLLCLIGVLAIISKGKINLLLNFKFTSGDLWMVGAAIGWAIYSIYLLHWKSNFSLMARFTLIALFGALTLFPFYILEEIFYFKTVFNNNFFFWVLFAAISPGIIAFTLYTKVQKYVGASLAGFTLYIFSIYSAKGGVVLAICKKYKLPIVAIGMGEKETDLHPFNAEFFSKALLGIED